MNKNYFLLRPNPSQHNRMNEFLEQSIIAVGWSDSGNLKHCNLKEKYDGMAHTNLNIFVNEMKEGDIVIIPNGDNIYFAQITSDYFYNDNIPLEDDYRNQRKVKFLDVKQRKDMPMEMRSILKTRHTSARLNKYSELIEKILKNEEIEDNSNKFETITLPLRPGKESVTITIPRDLTKQEAERLSNIIKTLYFKD
ncbi:hypothetical protein [Fusobacterium perfoetens]|uniref:hypothetical protein n=1 Tax=Fusobacterium perfoetens TaxID=852 RepID=UPI0004835548|nr:hypothetical protein [Fusobacterium perfoetens]MCI6152648.1 hypothetical protein [Fusobacterium perfoetens]MDY3237700.1 hypothetical protein [Fusobacterium perfoetens]